jgi:hypothetical protein
VKARDLVPTSLIGARGLLDHLPGQFLQDGVTSQAGNITEVRLVLDRTFRTPLEPLDSILVIF